jgi:hypothetical protein
VYKPTYQMDVRAHLSDMHTCWFWVFSEPALGSKSSPEGQHGSEKTQGAALQFEEQWKDAICASSTSNDHCVRFSARHAGKMGLSPTGRPRDY